MSQTFRRMIQPVLHARPYVSAYLFNLDTLQSSPDKVSQVTKQKEKHKTACHRDLLVLVKIACVSKKCKPCDVAV